MEPTKETKKKIKSNLKGLSYLPKHYKFSIENVDKKLFLCEIDMSNETGSETLRYTQVWDNQLDQFIFTKEQFLLSGISEDKYTAPKYENNIYFFFIKDEYLIYTTRKRKFISFPIISTSLSEPVDLDMKIASCEFSIDVHSGVIKFVELLDSESNKKSLLNIQTEKIIYTIDGNFLFGSIMFNKYIVVKEDNKHYIIDYAGKFLLDVDDDGYTMSTIDSECYNVVQLKNKFIFFWKKKSDIGRGYIHKGIFKDILYDKFIVWTSSKGEKLSLWYNGNDIKIPYNHDTDLTFIEARLECYVSVKISETSDFITLQHEFMPYRIFLLSDKYGTIRSVFKVDL
jgi:hypothetical protein